MPTGPLLFGPTDSVARTKEQSPRPPALKPVAVRNAKYVQKLGENAVRIPEMLFKMHTSVRVPLRPSRESERLPNIPAPGWVWVQTYIVFRFCPFIQVLLNAT